MPTTEELRAQADAIRAELAKAEAAANAAESGDVEPQNEAEALDSLLEAIISHCGNHPRLEAKLQKLRSFQTSTSESGQPDSGGTDEAVTG